MRAFEEDPGDVLAMKIVALTLGAAFILGGIGVTTMGGPLFGLPLMLIGCYVAAASLIGLRDGADGWPVFAPAGASALVALVGLAFATGVAPV